MVLVGSCRTSLTYQQVGRALEAVHVALTMEIPIIWQGLAVPVRCPAPGVGMRRFTGALLAAAFATAAGAPLAAGPAHAQDLSHADFSHAAAQYNKVSAPDAAQANAQDNAKSGDGQNCPGNPDALGTRRVLAIDPADYKRIGIMQYPDSLALADHEVVLTFDDGPLPPYSNQVLDILAAQCVKVTYFSVGEMARAFPAVVRREYEEGHTIGTHSEHHPTHFGALPIERMRLEIDEGISDVGAALGDPRYLAPFFRIPGLERSDTVENELAARNLIVFSSDTLADDWHRNITPSQITALALSRLETLGKGILLLHDIHPKTVAALPGILKGLKDKGFHVVQVVPSASYMIAMAKKPEVPMMLASATPEQLNISYDNSPAQPTWPETTASITGDNAVLPAPDPSAFEPDSGVAEDNGEVQWPEQPKLTEPSVAVPKFRGRRIAAPVPQRTTEVGGSAGHGRRHVEHPPARASAEGHRASIVTPKTFAATTSPAETVH
jgi:peptidoglycan/xylan/chitin deacetylase (PgdA/CDA1 family)